MKRILGFLMTLMICLGIFMLAGGVNTVYAADRSTEGSGYAVLTDDGELVLFRSNSVYSSGENQTVTDIFGNRYVGRVYADIETRSIGMHVTNSPWYEQRKDIKSVRVADGQKITTVNCSYWFYDCSNMTSCHLDGLDTSESQFMRLMFATCSSLVDLDISEFNTNSVVNMYQMFDGCGKLESIDLSSFDTNQVTNMSSMFRDCKSLKTLNLSNFNTSNVTSMNSAFSGCSSLTSLDLSSFDTSVVTDMRYMFNNCGKLTSLDVSGFDTSAVTDMSCMFYGCSNITSFDVSDWNTSKVINMSSMFSTCSKLTSVDVSNFDTSNVTDMSAMFNQCLKLSSVDVSGFNTSKVTSMSNMFNHCAFETIDVSNFDTSNVVYMQCMFDNCSALKSIDVSGFDTSNVITMNYMFENCSQITSLDLSNFDTLNVESMKYMFTGCGKLESLDLGNFDTSKVTDMVYMFSGCSSLKSVEIGKDFKFDGNNITSDSSKALLPTPSGAAYTGKWIREDGAYGPYTSVELRNNYTSDMAGTWIWEVAPCAVFSEDGTLSFIRPTADSTYTSGFTGTVKSISGGEYTGKIFAVNETATSSNGTWDSIASQVKKVVFVDEIKPVNTNYWFYNFEQCTNMDLAKLNTSDVTQMYNMFCGCSNLTSLNVTNFDTRKVTDMTGMFNGCSKLTSLNLSNFDTSQVTNMTLMFAYDFRLSSLDLSNFDTSSVRNMGSMFLSCSRLKSVKLGEDFSFKGSGIISVSDQAILPKPSGGQSTGKWIRDDDAYGPYTPAELRDDYISAMAGKWVWEERDPNGYVIFDANGGAFTTSNIKITFSASSGVRPFTTLGEDVTKFPGRFLLGWSEDKDATEPTYEPDTEINIGELEKTKTLYAVWTADGVTRYHVKHLQQAYDLSGYSLAETERLYGQAGVEVTPDVKTYEGFAQPSTQTVTLAADGSTEVEYKYDRLQYNVHFDGNGATSGQLADQKFLIGVGGTLRPNNYSKKGSIFTGWNTAPDGSGTSYTNGASVVDLTTEHGSTVTLYAQWLDNKDHATEPTDGAVRVTLKAGQTVVIPDLPAGTSYTIREVDNPQGWTFDHTDGETGTILANQTNSVTVYNVYHAVGSIPLQINKELVDGLTGESKPIEAGKFTFALIKSDGSQIQLASNEATDNERVIYDDEGNEVNNPNYGKAIVTFDPIAYDESDIGKTYTYRIGEVNTPEGYTASDPINVTVSIADAGQGQLDITAQYDNNQTITNTDNSGGKLEIKKLVSGSAPEGAEFTFKVDLTDETGKTYTDTVNGKKSDESNVSITSGETVSLHADESVVFNLPAGIGYTVSEQTQDGWTLVQSSGGTGTIVSEQTSTATFTNAYNVEGTVTLEADKVLTGKDLTANEFTFEVLDVNGNVVATGTNDAEGKVSLVIPYTAEDVGNTYEYTVHEVKPEGDTFGVTYDETIYGVSVAVSADNGKIVGNVSITDADKMTFTNTYDAKTDITVSGKKVLEGREFRDSDKWMFNLSSEDGPLPEETSVEITPINGDTFSFTIPFSVADMDGAQTKEFTYKVTESGSVLFVANDTSEKTFKVRVTDTKDGILKAELVDADNLDLTFTNKATVTLPATGSTTAIVLTIVGVAVIAGGLFFLLRKRKDDDEDE